MNFPIPKSWKKQPQALPGPSTMAFFLPNFFPTAFCLVYGPTNQPGTSAHWMVQQFPAMAMPLPGCASHCLLAQPLLSWFSAWGLHSPGVMALCCSELPRPSGTYGLTTLCSFEVVPNPFTTYYQLPLLMWATKTLSHLVLLLSSRSRMKNIRFSYSSYPSSACDSQSPVKETGSAH